MPVSSFEDLDKELNNDLQGDYEAYVRSQQLEFANQQDRRKKLIAEQKGFLRGKSKKDFQDSKNETDPVTGASKPSGGGQGKEHDPSFLRRYAGHRGGHAAQHAAQHGYKGKKLGGGKAAALGGAVSGLIEGQGAKGIAESAAGWYVLYFAFGALWSVVGFIPALVYLDIHFYLSYHSKTAFFVRMGGWQKTMLAAANFLLLMIPLVAVMSIAGTIYVGCNTSSALSLFSTFTYVTTAGQVDLCGPFKIDDLGGGRSGGGGASGSWDWEPADLVAITGAEIDPGTSDPRVRQCMMAKLGQLFGEAQAAGLKVAVTSAFRGDGETASGTTSAHSRGEAVDIALRDPTVPWDKGTNRLPVGYKDDRIAKLVSIALKYFPNNAQTNTLDEYNYPAPNATGGHIHLEYNIPSPPTNSYCAPFPNPPPTT